MGFKRAKQKSLPAGTYLCLGNRLEMQAQDLVEVGFDYIDCGEMVEDWVQNLSKVHLSGSKI
jgi:hypothetical protein